MNTKLIKTKVIIYEDDPDINDILAAAKVKALKAGKALNDLEVEVLPSISAFNEWWAKNQDNLTEFKFALLDIEIKHEDKEGIRAATLLRNKLSSDFFPIVFFTKHNGKRIRSGAYDAGATSYIKKPISTNRKIDRLSEILTYWYERNITNQA